MAKRGRPPIPEAKRRSVPLGIRITPALRKQLEATARTGNRSLSQEIELRLKGSFGKMEERFGGPTNFWLFLTIARRVQLLEGITHQKWWNDLTTFEEVIVLISTMFDYFRPKRREVNRKRLFGSGPAVPLGKQIAIRALADLETAMKISDVAPPWPHADEWFPAAGPLIHKMTRSALMDFLGLHQTSGRTKK
jgi:hypothetical protein